MDYKNKFISIFNEKISRQGSQDLLNWISSTDFFVAPASTKFHGAKEGGLVEHSVNVYEVLRSNYFDPSSDDEESFAICALLHDLCKINFYKISFKNVKDENGVWTKVPFYSINDSFPFGHGEKSVFLIERFMRLKPVEAVSIRWHMGAFDDSVKGAGYSSPINLAFSNYPLSVKLFISDLQSTYLLENSLVSKK